MIDVRPVAYVVGWLILMVGGLMTLPMAVDIGAGHPDAIAFAVSAVMTIVAGAALVLACASHRSTALSLRQGFLMTVVSWTLLPAVAVIPLMLGSAQLDFTDAYFEMVSAMTATGATVMVGLDTMPPGVLLWRGLVTWTGGIGVILLALILLPILNIGGMQMLKNADFNTLGKAMPRAKTVALSIGVTYLALTLACGLGFAWAGLSGIDVVVHAMSSVATGGMANYDSSFATFPPAAQYVATVFMLLGAVSFIRYVQMARGDMGALVRDTQVRTFFGIYLALALGLVFARWLAGEEIHERTIREVLFNLASVITTTGFATTDYSLWGGLAQTLFFCAMMICGCSGSTTGGPKVFRYQILYETIRVELHRLHSPNAVHIPRYQGEPISETVLNSVIAYFMAFFLTLALGAVALVLIGVDALSAISGAAAMITNVGPGFGPLIGPVGTYAPLPDAAKWVCSFLMLVGRLEIVTVYALLTVAFWRG